MAGSTHGHTPAAWTGVTIVFIGSCISGVFTVLAEPVGVVGGLVVASLGGVVGLAMRAAGLGQPRSLHEPRTTPRAQSRTTPQTPAQATTPEPQPQA